MSRLRRWAVTGIAALCLALPVAAQQQGEDTGPFREPGIRYRTNSSKPYLQWVVGAAIVVAGLMVAAKNPHRSHMD
jgi:hypothetical protein